MRLALFDIHNQRQLDAALAAVTRGTPAARWAPIFRIDPDRIPEIVRTPPSDAAAEIPVWYWHSSGEALQQHADELLRHVVFPLTHGRGAFCLAFACSRTQLAPRSLALATRTLLSLEDIGRLLEPFVADGRGRTAPPEGVSHGALDDPQIRPRATPHTVLDAAQRGAVEERSAAVRVLAPAGSGKTKTMINRVAALVGAGVSPARILVLAFNTRAAEQLEERLRRLGVPVTRRLLSTTGVHCATFNAFGYRYQRELLNAAPTVTTEPGLQQRLLRTAVWEELSTGVPEPQHGIEAACLDDLAWRAFEALAAARAACKPAQELSLALPPALSALDPGRRRSLPFAEVWRRYTAIQRSQGVQDFDDQIDTAVCDLLGNPDRRRALQDRFRHVLVDEFQDLNEMQLTLIDILSRPHRRLFVVGDDDQLIYGWRFARIENILAFPARMPAPPHCRSITLSTNYRCSAAIVAGASRLIANNRRRVSKTISCGPSASAGALLFSASPSWLLRAAAMSGYLADARTCGPHEWRDLAVLCRYRCQQPVAAAALQAASIPVAQPAPARLFTLPAAGVLRDCLGLLAGTAPETSAQRRTLAETSRRLGLRPAELTARLGAVQRWTQAARASPAEVILALGRELEIESRLTPPRPRAVSADGVEEGGPGQALEAALLLSLDFADLAGLLRRWDSWIVGERRALAAPATHDADGQDAVVISTIHAAKGREYEHVVVLDYQTDLSLLDEDDVEEERRVLYVAVTRARHTVLLTADTRKHTPHRFLLELMDPPSTEQARRLRAELRTVEARLARLQEQQPGSAPSVLPPLTGDHSRSASSTEATELAALRLRRLELSSRLQERRLAGRPSLLAALAARLTSSRHAG